MSFDSRDAEKLGLEGDVALAYHTLQRRNPLTLDELAFQANMQRDKILSVANELERAKLLELLHVVIWQISDNVMTISKGIQRKSPVTTSRSNSLKVRWMRRAASSRYCYLIPEIQRYVGPTVRAFGILIFASA